MPIRSQIDFDYHKLEELIVCIAERAPDIGLTKLEKLLYLCDFISAERTGLPITGETYRSFDMGPVPKHIKTILRGMQEQLSEEAVLLKSGHKFIKFTPLRKCQFSKFSEAEQEVITSVLQEFGSWASGELVEYVHQDLTYILTRRNEDIPYFLAPYRRYAKPKRDEAEQLLQDPGYVENIRSAFA